MQTLASLIVHPGSGESATPASNVLLQANSYAGYDSGCQYYSPSSDDPQTTLELVQDAVPSSTVESVAPESAVSTNWLDQLEVGFAGGPGSYWAIVTVTYDRTLTRQVYVNFSIA